MEPLHMVDAYDTFRKENVDRIISAKLSAPNAPYAVVSIVGAQGSGKSHLMNCLFGTKFPVLNRDLGSRQTSRGIMISSCIQPSLILLDVEGFDGKEKGEDTLFEKRAALFALVVSDLMMINISQWDIGRHQGGCTQLFETIFQERAKLPKGITKLVVVIRFYDGMIPRDVQRRNVLQRLETIWERANTTVQFKDYIEVNIFELPHINTRELPEEVTTLRNLISNHTSAKVPASGFSLSSSMYWDAIMRNKDLHIPSHQVAVATIYCRQLVEDIIKSLSSREEYKLLKVENSRGRFEGISHELLKNIKDEYDLNARKYDSDVRKEELEKLVGRLNMNFHILGEERKSRVKEEQRGLIALGMSAASMGATLISGVVTGDFLSPIALSVHYIWNIATKSHDSDSPSGSNDQVSDLSFN